MTVKEFNRLLSLLKNKNQISPEFYEFCAITIKAYIKKRFGNRIPLESTAYDVIAEKVYRGKKCVYVFAPVKWLRTITKRYVLDQLKMESRFTCLLDNIKYEPYYEDIIEKEDLKSALKQLDKLSLKIVVLFYIHGYNYNDISGILNISSSCARSRACRAIKFLKEILKNV